MAYRNRIGQATATTGTGAITLGAAITDSTNGNLQALGAGDDGDTFDILIVDGSAWEIAVDCTYTHGTTSLTRGTLEESSTGAALNLSGSAKVYVTASAARLQDLADHLASTSNPHGVTAEQVGADPEGSAASTVTAHAAETDPHTGYVRKDSTEQYPTRVKPVDYFGGAVVAADSTYLYRINDSSDLQRATKANPSSWTTIIADTDVAGLGYIGQRNFRILASGTWLWDIYTGSDATQVHKICRSDDDGATWTVVATLTTGTSILGANRGWCELANGDVIICEYNTTAVASHRILRLTNDAQNLSVIATLNNNTDGQHSHFVGQDPYTGEVYFGFGDADEFCGVLAWDGTTAWPSGNPVTFSGTGFRSVGGSQRLRVTDIAFTEDYLYHFADASNESANIGLHTGIWRFDRTLDAAQFVRLNGDVDDTWNAGTSKFELIGLLSLATSSGQVLFVPYIDTGTDHNTQNELPIWATRDGVHCEQIAVYYTEDTQTAGLADDKKSVPALWEDTTTGRIYMACNRAGGKGDRSGTAVFTITTDTWMGPSRDVVHPVFWSDPVTGASGNSGEDPRNPKNALFASWLSNTVYTLPDGGCVMLGANTYTEAGGNMGGWPTTTDTYDTEDGLPVQIRGEGKGVTAINITSYYGFANVAGLSMQWSDLSIDCGSSTYVFYGNSNASSTLVAQDCYLGGDAQVSVVRTLNGQWDFYRCKLENTSVAAGDYVGYCGTTGVTHGLGFYSCVLRGGVYAIYANFAADITMYNCAIVGNGGETGGLFLAATCTVAPSIYNTVIAQGNLPINDQASLTFTEMDYLVVSHSSSGYGVADAELGEHSFIHIDAGVKSAFFKDPDNDDFTPLVTAVSGVGVTPSHLWGYDGQRLKVANIGPFGVQKANSGLRLDDLAPAEDNEDLNASTTAHGLMPKLSGDGGLYFNGAGAQVQIASTQLSVSATDKILGRSSAGAGDIEEIACTAAGRALLDDTTAAAQRATLSAGYSIVVCSTATTVADATTYYWGVPNLNAVTTATRNRIYIPRTGILKAAYVFANCGAASTNENWGMLIRHNDTTDYSIATVGNTEFYKVWSNTGLSISVTAGDYIEMKTICPTWATKPGSVRLSGTLWIE